MGWFFMFPSQKFLADVTAITISKKQYEKVKEKVYREDLTEKVKVKLTDYREIKGIYDKIVSIEMFEAVGEKYWSKYFDVLGSNLKQNGAIGLQTITIEDKFFKKYRKFPDFIQTYIFPGGMLPSIEEMSKVLTSKGLTIEKKQMFGNDYAKTLRMWSRSFESSWDNIKKRDLMILLEECGDIILGIVKEGLNQGILMLDNF